MCKPCYTGDYQRRNPDKSGNEWKRRNPERAKILWRRQYLKKHYGITIEQWDEAYAAQDGRCANPGCRKAVPPEWEDHRNGMQVDHDHRTGRFRGLLCKGCNSALGHIDDDPARLAGLVAYLEMN